LGLGSSLGGTLGLRRNLALGARRSSSLASAFGAGCRGGLASLGGSRGFGSDLGSRLGCWLGSMLGRGSRGLRSGLIQLEQHLGLRGSQRGWGLGRSVAGGRCGLGLLLALLLPLLALLFAFARILLLLALLATQLLRQLLALAFKQRLAAQTGQSAGS